MKHFAVMFFIIALWCTALPSLQSIGFGDGVHAAVGEESKEESVEESAPSFESVQPLSVRVKTEKEDLHLSIEEYTARALSAVMAEDAPTEALKAQVVAIRSFVLHRLNNPCHEDFDVCVNPNCCYPLSNTPEVLCVKAASDTKGQILCYENEAVLGLSHLSSCICTESYGDCPYLQSVPVYNEEQFECYKTHYSFEEALFATELSLDLASLPDKLEDWVDHIEFTSGNRVKTVSVCGKSFSGGEFSHLLGLDSLCFTVNTNANGFDVVCYGSGSGYGLSRCTAMLMGAEGKDYREILSCFYPETELRFIKD